MGKNVPVRLSNGEHVFTPEEVAILESQGVDMNTLAPNAKDGYSKKTGGRVPKGYKLGGKLKGQTNKYNSKKGLNPDSVYFASTYGGYYEVSIDDEEKIKEYEEIDYMRRLDPKNPEDLKTIIENQYIQATEHLDFITEEINEKSIVWTQDDLEKQKRKTERLAKELEDIKTTTPATATTNNAVANAAAANVPVSTTATTPTTTTATAPAATTPATTPATKKTIGIPDKNSTKDERIAFQKQLNAEGFVGKNGKPLVEDGDFKENTYFAIRARDKKNNASFPTIEPKKTPDKIEQKPTPAPQSPYKDGELNQMYKTQMFNESVAAAEKEKEMKALKTANTMKGISGALALGQVALGLSSLGEKRPKYEVDKTYLSRLDDALKSEKYGFEPAVRTNAENKFALGMKTLIRNSTNMAGGNAGSAFAMAKEATGQYAASNLELAAQDQAIIQTKKARTDTLAAGKMQAELQKYNFDLDAFKQNQAASAELINAGIGNFVGNIQYSDTLKRLNERLDKFG